jgi:hypothetical protein
MRTSNTVHRSAPLRRPPVTPSPARNKRRIRLCVALIIIGLVSVLYLHNGRTVTSDNAIRSGISGACLDVFHSEKINNVVVDTASCNGTSAQNWTTTAFTIRHQNTNSCLSTTSGGLIALDSCSDVPGQVWLRDNQGYYNPNTGKCLTAGKVGTQLQLGSCNNMSWDGVTWNPESAAQAPVCNGSKGSVVVCETAKEWAAWVATGSNHESLLTKYTDGTPYEQWCADFISYVYKESGFPFTSGSADGWDENDANSVQYMGFTMHPADGSYLPKAGDVAFFNYPGSHVEVVVSGGKNPTFIYGDSAEIDPTTGNGQMKANTITQDSSGQLEYYLSPNA